MDADLSSRPKGTWIAYVNGNEVASGMDLKMVIARMRKKHPDATPLLAQVPREETLIV